MREAVIVSLARTPVGKYAGGLSSISAADLGAIAIKEAVKRAKIDPNEVDDVIFGNILNNDWQNIARAATLAAGLPLKVPAITVDRECSSGVNSIVFASAAIQCGYYDIAVAGGIESDSRRPYVMAKQDRAFSYNSPVMYNDPPSVTDAIGEVSMGMTAENVAEKYQITRQECDEFALRSHQLAAKAWEQGFFDQQVVPVEIPQKKGNPVLISSDETVRKDTALDKLGKLRPVFKKDGIVTAGNSSPLCDGAAAVVMMEKGKAQERGLEILGKVAGYAVAGVHPHYMGIGPVDATNKLLKKTGLKLKDIDLIELNEAFAAQSVPCIRELGFDINKVNVNGGAIALGHPMGATGAILTGKLIYELRRRDKHLGLVTMCMGGGQGIAVLIERL